MKQFLKELDYKGIIDTTKTNARSMFRCSAFIILFAMIAYPNTDNVVKISIQTTFLLNFMSNSFLYCFFGYKVINIKNKHPIFEAFISYIFSIAIIPIQIPLLKMLLDIPNNPDIVFKVILIWFGFVVGLGVIGLFARDFGPKNYAISCYDDETNRFIIGSPGTGKKRYYDSEGNIREE